MNALHAAAWPIVAVGLAGIAGAAAVAALRDRSPRLLDLLRQGALVVLVAEAAIGLSLALRGSGPDELLHWVYGGVVIGALLMPAALPDTVEARRRSWMLAGGAALGVVLVWRLWASG